MKSRLFSGERGYAVRLSGKAIWLSRAGAARGAQTLYRRGGAQLVYRGLKLWNGSASAGIEQGRTIMNPMSSETSARGSKSAPNRRRRTDDAPRNEGIVPAPGHETGCRGDAPSHIIRSFLPFSISGRQHLNYGVNARRRYAPGCRGRSRGTFRPYPFRCVTWWRSAC